MKKLPIYVLSIAVLIVVLVLGGILGWFIRGVYHSHSSSGISQNTSNTQVRVNLPQYSLISPPLFSETAKSNSPAFKTLADSLTAYIASTTAHGAAESVSVYFRDLNNASWTGVNENDTYTPSSMLKVVAMMAALKLAEQNPSLINEQLPYIASSSPFTQYYEPDDNMKTGDYSVQDLIGSMIRYSDNNALDSLLSDQAINNEFSEIYGLYRLPVYSATDTTDFMSPKSYSGLFISLYNSTLFPWDLSEQVLNLLANTTFTQGLAAGVPAGTVVAHKFGENSDVQGGTGGNQASAQSSGTVVDRELHDCGIIYAPGKPYILCVMTKGSGAGAASSSFPTLAGVIAGVSKLVYGQVTAPNTGL